MTASQPSDPGLRYLRVANSLRTDIVGGQHTPGERLPRQHDLAKHYGVAFSTLKQALDLLEREGYVRRKAGMGTYATIPEEKSPTALVVDDDKAIRDVFKKSLAATGWRSVEAQSGEVALVELQQRSFEVIFLDLFMHGMNGVETFREIRAADPNANVVIATAYPDSDLMAEALEIGPFAVMRKPFTMNQLHTVLRHAARPLSPQPGGWT